VRLSHDAHWVSRATLRRVLVMVARAPKPGPQESTASPLPVDAARASGVDLAARAIFAELRGKMVPLTRSQATLLERAQEAPGGGLCLTYREWRAAGELADLGFGLVRREGAQCYFVLRETR
jgi:hypothetical protein